ncbi:MAG: hypothetical protein LBD41_08135 [Clostridiales Family XIII bacterium]|jgi:hypothetical protein|nr:hypothetical protein [Clostridiales Family XIII bacterium]
MKTSNIYFFPLLIKPVTASADEIYFYSQSLDEQLMNKSDIEKIINNLKNKNAIWSKESDAYFKLNDVS